MKIEKIVVNACCGRKNIVFKLGQPIDLSLLDKFKSAGFTEQPHFTKAGMIYAENLDLVVSGPIGADRLNVRCKKTDCEEIVNNFEELLTKNI